MVKFNINNLLHWWPKSVVSNRFEEEVKEASRIGPMIIAMEENNIITELEDTLPNLKGKILLIIEGKITPSLSEQDLSVLKAHYKMCMELRPIIRRLAELKKEMEGIAEQLSSGVGDAEQLVFQYKVAEAASDILMKKASKEAAEIED